MTIRPEFNNGGCLDRFVQVFIAFFGGFAGFVSVVSFQCFRWFSFDSFVFVFRVLVHAYPNILAGALSAMMRKF